MSLLRQQRRRWPTCSRRAACRTVLLSSSRPGTDECSGVAQLRWLLMRQVATSGEEESAQREQLQELARQEKKARPTLVTTEG